MSTNPRAIEFLNTLVDEVSTHWGVASGVHVHPDGTLGSPDAEPRHIFMEAEVLDLDRLHIDRIELASSAGEKLRSQDLVVATLPLGLKPAGRGRSDEMIDRLVKSAQLLSEDGVGVLFALPFYRTFRVGKLAEALSGVGVNVHGIVNAPPEILMPHTSIQPMFVVVSRRPCESTFALDCRTDEALGLNISNFLSHGDTRDLRTGVEVDLNDFRGFEHWYAQREIDSLEGDYTRFEKFKVEDIALDINLTKKQFEDIEGAVFLPMIGNSEAVSKLSATTLKHQNYAQIVVNPELTTPEFVCNFFNTRNFRLYLEAEKVAKGQVIPKLNLEQVRQLPVALPDFETQAQISTTVRKLSELSSMVNELSQNILLNPVSSTSMTQQVDEALSVFGRLSAEDQIISLLRQGETKNVEFKQTFSLDVADLQKKPYIEDAAIKTIAAFLNSDGGDLLVGVDDSAHITGIDFEIDKLHKSNRDGFLKHFKNKFKDRIGEPFYPKVSYGLIDVGEMSVFRVTCEPSDIEVFVDGKDFYVRTNPATDRLEGPKLLEYVKHRFKTPATSVLAEQGERNSDDG